MPLRSDPTVWYNLPGVVAAYQPIGAPGPLLARYNQAHGGDNRYRCEPGTLPAWAGHTGWTFNISATQYFNTGLVPSMDTTWSFLALFDYSPVGGGYPTVAGVRQGTTGGEQDFIISADDGATGTANYNRLRNGVGNTGLQLGPPRVEGVVGFAGLAGYVNGMYAGAISSAATTNTRPLFVGCMNNIGSSNYFFRGTISCVYVVARTLSSAEVWHASRQMAYCHVNPDWSAWGRKRRWYYAPSAAGFQAGWAAHSNAQIGTGVN